MLILHSPLSLKHRTVEFASGKLQGALESPERITSILEALRTSQHELVSRNIDVGPDGQIPQDIRKFLDATHDSGYITHLSSAHKTWVAASAIEPNESILPECFTFPARTKSTHPTPPEPPNDMFARAGFYAFDMSTGIMAETYPAAVASADLALHGANLLSSGSANSVFSLCRPPGHHCDARRAGGFCYINNAVIAAVAMQQTGTGSKVGILDIDFHHGNGTQEYFYSSSDVLYVSIHGEDEFPYYTGAESEIGTGAGEGCNINLPLKTGSSVAAYLEKLNKGLQQLEEYEPKFLIVSLGFDTFHLDPLGNFKIDTEDYQTIAHQIRSKLEGIPALILLEGGYVIDRLGDNVLSFLAGWESAEAKESTATT